MTRSGVYGLAIAASLMAGLGCRSACDQGELSAVADALEARTVERRTEGIEALARACPTMPRVLRRSLEAAYGGLPPEDQATIHATRVEDVAWQELLARTCPGEPPPGAPSVSGVTLDPATRERCGLDRYGLLAPGDPFVARDLVAFGLYQWLIGHRVDRARAEAVVRPLLAGSASPEQLDALCRAEGVACAQVVEGWELRPPRSAWAEPREEQPMIRITPDALRVGQRPALSLSKGRPPPPAFAHHVSPRLRGMLEAHAEAADAPEQWHPLLVAADRTIPAATLIDTLFTAHRAGWEQLALQVLTDRGLRAIPLGPPRQWHEPKHRNRHRFGGPTFVVRDDSVQVFLSTDSKTFARPARCPPAPHGCYDHTAIAAYSRELFDIRPHEVVFRVEGEVSVQALVDVIDTVRGAQACATTPDDAERLPEGCYWLPMALDAEPPLYFFIDQSFALGEAIIEPGPRHAGRGPTEPMLRRTYTLARERMERCLAEVPGLLAEVRQGSPLRVTYGLSGEPRRTTASVVLPGYPPGRSGREVELCILEAVGAKPLEQRSFEVVQAEVVVPVLFEPDE